MLTRRPRGFHLQFSLHGKLLSSSFFLSAEEERNSAELSELQHLHQVMNGIGVTVIHGNHPKLPDVCVMCERDSPEKIVSIWEEKLPQEPNILTIEAVCVNGKEEKDEVLLELTRLQRELMDVEKENERILTSLEEVVINEIQEAQHLRDSYHDAISQYSQYIQTYHPERGGYGVTDSSRCEVCNQIIENDMLCVCIACGCCAHKLCACMDPICTEWMCIACADTAQFALEIQPSVVSDQSYSLEAIFNEQTLNRIKTIRSQIHCILCGYSSGLLFRTIYEGVYAHPACACWLPGVTLSNHVYEIQSIPPSFSFNLILSPLHSLPYINPHPSSFSTQTCCFCKRQGYCVICPIQGCTQSYHVICAFKNGLEVQWHSNVCMEENQDTCLFGNRHRILCSHHSYNRIGIITPNRIADGSWIDPQMAEWKDYAFVRWNGKIDSNRDVVKGVSWNCLLREGQRDDVPKKREVKKIEKELRGLEQLRVCELIDVWEVPVTWINEGGVCVRKNDISLGLVSTTGRKNEKKRVRAQALKDGLVLCGRDQEKDQVTGSSSDGRTKKRSRSLKASVSQPTNSPPSESLEDSRKRKRCRLRSSSLNTVEPSLTPEDSHPVRSVRATKDQLESNQSHQVIESLHTSTPNRSTRSSELEKTKTVRKNRRSSMNQVQLKRVSILPAPKLPLASQRTLPNNLPANISKSVLLSQFLESSSFLQLTGDDSQFKNNLSLRSFLDYYFVGISLESIHSCIQENLPSDAKLIPHSSNAGLTVNQVLERIRKSRKVDQKITLIRAFLRVSLISVYPPHMCVSSLAQTKGTKERNSLAEVHRLGILCEILFTLSLEMANILRFSENNETSLEDQNKTVHRQCICLSRENLKERLLVCMKCGVGYHPSCLALELTDCPDLVLTKNFGYWSLDRGFLCPACCKGDIFEMSPTLRGCVQIRDTAVIAWQNKLRKKVYVSRR